MKHVLQPFPLLLAFGALGAALFVLARGGDPWWLVGVGVVGPDLSFLAALGGPAQVQGRMPARVVRPYNALHHPLGPAACFVLGVAWRSPEVAGVALAWGSHLLWDRGVGYGRRAKDGTIITNSSVSRRASRDAKESTP